MMSPDERDQMRSLAARVEALEAEQKSMSDLLYACILLSIANASAGAKSMGEMRSLVAMGGKDTSSFDTLYDSLQKFTKRMIDALKRAGIDAS